MKKTKKKDVFLAELKKIPIVSIAAEKSGLSRNTVYRWRATDEAFSKEMDDAMLEGEALINDLTEANLLTLIQEKNWSAISFWLRLRNPKFREKIDVNTTINDARTLTPEEEDLKRKALSMVSFTKPNTTQDGK